MIGLKISIEPSDALIDVPRRMVISGAEAGAVVEVTAETPRSGHLSRASADFPADDTGEVDLTKLAPIGGDYTDVSAMGLVWAQHRVEDTDTAPPVFNADMAEPLITTITARAGGASATAQFVQRLMSEGVTQQDVSQDGLVGTLFHPAGHESARAIVILNGSGGGIKKPRAALWASHGYNALALGYFGAPGMPKYISNTPLEYFERGIDWLRYTVKPRGDFVALAGQSKGGELALLLGSTFPDKVSAVIGYVPCAFVHGGQAASDPAIGRDGPAWTFRSEELDHIWKKQPICRLEPL